MSTRPLAALTGATGFIGQHLVRAFSQAGWSVRILLRRDPAIAEWQALKPEVVRGDLDDRAALGRLVDGADAVVHLAGLIKATRRDAFFAVNRDGSANVARAAKDGAPAAHFVHVSSLAAREPQLSDYAASKRAGEDAAREVLGGRLTVLRPPAVYGPGDRETLVFFQLAKGRLVPLLGGRDARAALIHGEDLARLIVAIASRPPAGETLTAADGRPDGYRWEEVLGTAARCVGNASPKFIQAPMALLRSVALAGDVGKALGSANMLTSQKLREVRHPDWSVSPAELATADGWSPRYTLDQGFADAVAWYRREGWL